MAVSFELLMALFLVACMAGLVDTLVGGGGLICIPILILTGLSPIVALGTNKVQGSLGTFTAALVLVKQKRFKWSRIRKACLFAFLGAALGTGVIQFIDSQVLTLVVPIVLGLICLYFLFVPRLKLRQEALMSERVYQRMVVPFIGAYDGMFGPGTGSFFTLSGVSLQGLDVITATARAKPLNFSTNFASVLVFLVAGKIHWPIGIVMMLGQVVGAWLGAHTLYRLNPAWLRWLIVVVSVSMLLKYCHGQGWFAELL